MQTTSNLRATAGALILALVGSAHAVTTVGVYAPNPNALSIVDAASNSLANGISLAAFGTLVSSAFAANQGGVIDFEVASGWPVNSNVNTVNVTYGTAQTASLTINRTDTGNFFNSNNNTPTLTVSGASYFGQSAVNGVYTFSTGLSALGFTMISRGADRTSSLTLTLDDASTITTSVESITSGSTAAKFFGVRAPSGRSIVGMTLNETGGFIRYDDLGFVQAVPEPTSMAALALGGLALLRKRRK